MKQILAQLAPEVEKCLLHNDNSAEPIMTGPVCMHQTGPNGNVMKVRLLGKAYGSNFGHYVVFYQDKKYSKACAYINLKNCSVQSDGLVVKIVSKDCDGMGLTMSLQNDQEVKRWVEALKPKDVNFKLLPNGSKSPVVPRSPLMPTLEESEEE